MCREHNNANIIAMGSRTAGIEICKQMVEVFLTTDFDTENPNHKVRCGLLKELDEGIFKLKE